MPYLSYAEAQAFYGHDLEASELETIWSASADQVQILAPPPLDEDGLEPADYAPRARHTERMLGAWLSAGGHLFDVFGNPQSKDNMTLKKQRAQDIVAEHMGRYYKAGARGLRIRDIARA
jgi:hypothetical protein